jgi:signal transduction histidine kinase
MWARYWVCRLERFVPSKAIKNLDAALNAGRSARRLGAPAEGRLRRSAERKRLEREILEVSSRERHSIGRDLHDGLGQELTGVALMLRALATRLEVRAPEMVGQVNEIVGVVNQSIDSVRSLVRGLLPVSLHRGGLAHALRTLATRSRTLHRFDVAFDADVWSELPLDEAGASHLYRIAQEALTNAARHGQATAVDIYLRSTPTTFLLQVADNGCGIAADARAPEGMGLRIMEYRAGMIGAKLEIVANEPRGTMVRVIGENGRAGLSV